MINACFYVVRVVLTVSVISFYVLLVCDLRGKSNTHACARRLIAVTIKIIIISFMVRTNFLMETGISISVHFSVNFVLNANLIALFSAE